MNESIMATFFTTSIMTSINLIFMNYTWRFCNRLWDDTSKYIRKWEKNENVKPPKGFYGRLVMWNVKSSLKKRYSELPKIGDLLQSNATEKMFVVTARHEPNPISPHGYVELTSMEEGNKSAVRIAVTSYFKDSYEKVTPDEND